MAKQCPNCYRRELVETEPARDHYTCQHCTADYSLEELEDNH